MDQGDRSLKDIPIGERVFIDSNFFSYHLLNHRIYGAVCREFIEDIQDGEYCGFISPVVVSETIFNFIKAYIFKEYGIKPAEAISMIKVNPKVLSEISLDRPKELFEILNLLPIGKLEVEDALMMVNEYSLLTNDALNAAAMAANKIISIATNDGDFERIEGLKLWKP